MSVRPITWLRLEEQLADQIACYTLALRLIALRRGSQQPSRPAEVYWVEQNGGIP